MSKVCCGITYSDKDRFCGVCGKRLEDIEERTVLINEQQIHNTNEDDEPGTSVLTADMRGPIKHPENEEQDKSTDSKKETVVKDNTADDKIENKQEDSNDSRKEESPADSKDSEKEESPADNKDSEKKDSPADNKDSEKKDSPADSKDSEKEESPVDDKENDEEKGSADNKDDEDDEDSITSMLTADMKKPMPGQMPPMQNGRPMQPMPSQMPPMQNGRPMQPMPGQMQPMQNGRPMQQPAKPKKSEEQKEKSAKTCGLVSLIVSAVGLVAVGVMLFFFVINADYKKYDKEAEKGLYYSTETTETASFGDTLNSEEE
ncbi:MAG: hypothetical protein K2G45_11840 [Lachnospiraceae bacterium]|nr:hypothetical protein [Lachnospiraceae bacterium]